MSPVKKQKIDVVEPAIEDVPVVAPPILSPESHISMATVLAQMSETDGPSKPGVSSVIIEADEIIDGERFKRTPQGLFKYS